MPKISRNEERVKIKFFQKNIGSPNSPENNLIKYSKKEKVLTPVGMISLNLRSCGLAEHPQVNLLQLLHFISYLLRRAAVMKSHT